MDLSFKLNGYDIKTNIKELRGRWAAQVQCPQCSKKYKCNDALNSNSAKYRVRDTLKCHMRRKHNGKI